MNKAGVSTSTGNVLEIWKSEQMDPKKMKPSLAILDCNCVECIKHI